MPSKAKPSGVKKANRPKTTCAKFSYGITKMLVGVQGTTPGDSKENSIVLDDDDDDDAIMIESPTIPQGLTSAFSTQQNSTPEECIKNMIMEQFFVESDQNGGEIFKKFPIEVRVTSPFCQLCQFLRMIRINCHTTSLSSFHPPISLSCLFSLRSLAIHSIPPTTTCSSSTEDFTFVCDDGCGRIAD